MRVPSYASLQLRRFRALAWGLASLLTCALAAHLVPYRLLVNRSPSVPPGLYLLRPTTSLGRGNLVVVRLPVSLLSVLVARGYLPSPRPLLKPIQALPGDQVCLTADTLIINGVDLAPLLTHDRQHRSLALWPEGQPVGCITLAPGELFLVSTRTPFSLDSRVFGPLRRAAVLGVATLLWAFTEEAS